MTSVVKLKKVSDKSGNVVNLNDMPLEIKKRDDGKFEFKQGELYIDYLADTEESGYLLLFDEIQFSIENYLNIPASKLKSTMTKDINSALKKYIA